jgi:uncharacterized protein (TIGR04255 family)
MADELNPLSDVSFDSPPVAETALSVQFSKIVGYTAAHSGWFWKEYLEKQVLPVHKWPTVLEQSRIEDRIEKFGAEEIWTLPSIKVTHGVVSPRVQLIRSDGERMLQLQDSKLVLNWKKKTESYPRFKVLSPEFHSVLAAFEGFMNEAGLGTPQYNQWELVYVNHLKKGDLWQTVSDWVKIFPSFRQPPIRLGLADATMGADWRFTLDEQRGRLYLALRQARLPISNEEILQLTMTARGEVSTTRTLEEGLSIGHTTLVNAFMSLISPEAQRVWKMKNS